MNEFDKLDRKQVTVPNVQFTIVYNVTKQQLKLKFDWCCLKHGVLMY